MKSAMIVKPVNALGESSHRSTYGAKAAVADPTWRAQGTDSQPREREGGKGTTAEVTLGRKRKEKTEANGRK